MGNQNSQMIDSIVSGSNFDRDEVDRLRKRFSMSQSSPPLHSPSFGSLSAHVRPTLSSGYRR